MGKSFNFFNAKLAAIVRRKVKWANRAVLGHAYQGYYGTEYQPQKTAVHIHMHGGISLTVRIIPPSEDNQDSLY